MDRGNELPDVSGEIGGADRPILQVEVSRIGVHAESEKERAAQQEMLRETEARLAKLDAEIRKLEAAAKAEPTKAERAEMDKKVDRARREAEKAWEGDQEMVARLVDATKKTFLEGREGISEKLTALRQRREDAETQKALIEQDLRGEEPS